MTDCVAASAASCTGADVDPGGGQFLVNGIDPGSYTLAETKAPTGFVLDASVKTVTVADQAQPTALSDVVSQQQQVPRLPLTGGSGPQMLAVAATGLFALALMLAVLHLLRRRQNT